MKILIKSFLILENPNKILENPSKILENPNYLGVYENWNPADPSQYSAEIFTIKPKPGEIVLFPSWLRHGSSMVENHTIDRTVISFNAV